MQTLDTVLARHKGFGPGFDFLRIALAISIVCTHAFLLTGNDHLVRTTGFWFVEYALVPMFFALSGFLVAGSAMRLSLKNFLINRSLRIAPALAVDVVVCALIIGPLITTVALSDYYTSRKFFSYFTNIIGWIHYELPGVFRNNPSFRVNGALWTVPYEIFCYIIMSWLILSRWILNARLVAILTAAILVVGVVVQFWPNLFPTFMLGVMKFAFIGRGNMLLLAFLMGILLYQLRDSIPYSRVLFLACVAVCVVADIVLDSSAIGRIENRFLVLPALVYITIFIGVTNIPLPKLLHTGDYSYGIYLYHDPLLQVIITLIPAIVLVPIYGAAALFLLGIPLVAVLAAFSWHFIERPILGLRKRFSFVAKVRGVDEAPERAAPKTAAMPQEAS